MERSHLSRDEMLRAIGMLEAGMRQIDVANAIGTSQSVISRLFARYRETGAISERHPGRHRITTRNQDRFLQMTARRIPTVTAPELQRQLQQAHGIALSSRTVINRLHEANLRSRRPLRVQPLRRGNRGARLIWAQEHVLWNNFQWASVLFTDESRFGIHPDSRRVRIWRQPGNENRLQHVQEVHSFRGGTIMVWGGISFGGRTDLVLIENFLNAVSYRNQILQPIVLPYAAAVGENFILMHDNARCHVAATVSEFLNESGIDVLPWPAQSPDLNPIEQAWDMLQRGVLRGGNNFQNREQLFAVLQESWRLIPQQDLNNLILSMQRRCRAVVNSRGGHTNY
ncbi:hypothetical protein ABEB36_009381 [Hypothenemus hampei]|uniref:Transposase n=1 Tax=Hypothenemus hampei TaxID=57062 RepID=A0ABD1EG83_HYPHA